VDAVSVALAGTALAASAAAGVRAVARCGLARGLLAAALPVAISVAAFALRAPAFVGAALLVGAVAALAKSLALSRERCRALPLPQAAAYLVAYPWLHPEWAFARDPRPRRDRGLRALGVGAAEVVLAFGWAGLARRLGLLEGPLFVAAWARVASLVLLLDGAFRAAAGAFRAAGLRAEEAFRSPWAMTDLRDFWGRRWNRIVGRTLALEVFAPARRRVGGAAAVLLTFLASGLVHEVVLVGPTGESLGAYLAFFGLHGLAILALDRWLPGPGRTRSGRLARRLWAWAILLATAPLFFGAAYREAVPLEDLVP
jgi:hypothetical protein